MPMELFALAEKEGIKIEWWNFEPPLEAVYWVMPGLLPIIGLADSLAHAPRAYFRCVLAEEIGHHFTTTGYRIPRTYFHYRDRLEISQAEYRALKWAAQWLVPKEKLVQTLRKGVIDVWELADYFGVTEEMVKLRLSLPDVAEVRLAG